MAGLPFSGVKLEVTRESSERRGEPAMRIQLSVLQVVGLIVLLGATGAAIAFSLLTGQVGSPF